MISGQQEPLPAATTCPATLQKVSCPASEKQVRAFGLETGTLSICSCPLQYGASYYIAVSAVNAAGLVGTVKSQSITIQHESQNLSPAKVAGIVISCVLGTGIAVAALTIWITSRRYSDLLWQALRCPCSRVILCEQGRQRCPSTVRWARAHR